MLLIRYMINTLYIIIVIAFVFNVLLIMVRIRNWIFLNGRRFLEKKIGVTMFYGQLFLK